MITITDEYGSKKVLVGSIEGFSIKNTHRTRKRCSIEGLDVDWGNKKVIVVLVEGNNYTEEQNVRKMVEDLK